MASNPYLTNSPFLKRTHFLFHSIPSFGNASQPAGQQYASRNEVFDGDGKTCEMELAGAYAPETGVRSLVRRCEMGEGYITVTDSVKLNTEGEMCFNYTLYNEPKLVAEGKVDIGGAILEYDPEGMTATVEKIENKFLPYEDLNFEAKWGVPCLWRLVLKTAAAEKALTVKIS